MFRLIIKGDLGYEAWADIPGYEGLYQASTYGRIKSVERVCIRGRGGIQRVPEKLICISLTKQGYCFVRLSKMKKKNYLIHRLVALTFLPKPQNGQTQINHKSENKTENQVWNLEWCTPCYNTNYGKRNNIVSQKLAKEVIQYDTELNIINKYNSLSEINEKNNFNKASISACCNGKRKTAYGYIWKFA